MRDIVKRNRLEIEQC
jgi:cell shape-determining protein MreC